MKHIKELSRKIENIPSGALCLNLDIEYKMRIIEDNAYRILNNHKN